MWKVRGPGTPLSFQHWRTPPEISQTKLFPYWARSWHQPLLSMKELKVWTTCSWIQHSTSECSIATFIFLKGTKQGQILHIPDNCESVAHKHIMPCNEMKSNTVNWNNSTESQLRLKMNSAFAVTQRSNEITMGSRWLTVNRNKPEGLFKSQRRNALLSKLRLLSKFKSL